MGKISLLDDNTINQIAAGEVVERPYSIVKELVENSIDALSTSITVEIRGGGKTLIRVTDNGTGIEPDDMSSAFLRHSTSKIHKADDLQNIMTLGFRGEALASIASVSQVDMVSKTRDFEFGRRLVIYGGEVREDSEVGTSNGTTVVVKNVFYNIPVRKKFLKSDLSESSAISDLIYRLAMSNPTISFKYIKDGVTLIKTPGSDDLDEAIYALFGKELIESTKVLSRSRSESGVSLEGRTSKSTHSRGNRSRQYIFVNGRSVKSMDISKCIERVYGDLIPKNRFPLFVLFLEIDPKYIDVNIHPSKTEIRFLRQKELLDFIEVRVRGALSREGEIIDMNIGDGSLSKGEIPVGHGTELMGSGCKNILSKERQRGMADRSRNSSQTLPCSREASKDDQLVLLEPRHLYGGEKSPSSKYPKSSPSSRTPSSTLVKSGYTSSHKVQGKSTNVGPSDSSRESDAVFESSSYQDVTSDIEDGHGLALVSEAQSHLDDKEPKEDTSRFPELKLIGKLFGNYIMAENLDCKELFIIDQHAAHERVMYEALKREVISEHVFTQEILSPETIELSLAEYDRFKEHGSLFSRLGFDLEEFGQNTILIRGVPMVLGRPSSSDFFLEVLDSLDDGIVDNYQLRLDKLMKLACSSAIKSGDRTDSLEDTHLLRRLKECENPYTCPHGRPTVMKISKAEVEKRFKRS